MQESTGPDILLEFQQGKPDAFYKAYYPPLLNFAVYCLGKELELLAEDCVQNAIFKAWQRKESFQHIFSLRSFLYTTIKNEAINLCKKSNASDTYLNSLIDEPEEPQFVEVELMAVLYQAIDKLPDIQRRVLELGFMEGLKNAEIAERLDLSESSVKKYKARALENLKNSIDPSILYFLLLFSQL